MAKRPIDIGRVRRGMRTVRLTGVPNTPARLRLIEAAAAAILRDSRRALEYKYMGIAVRRGRETRHDAEYEAIPRRWVRFRIERHADGRAPDADAAYALRAAGAFVSAENPVREGPRSRPERLNLFEALKRLDRLEAQARALRGALGAGRMWGGGQAQGKPALPAAAAAGKGRQARAAPLGR